MEEEKALMQLPLACSEPGQEMDRLGSVTRFVAVIGWEKGDPDMSLDIKMVMQ